MKKLIMINGTMGVGKSEVSRQLLKIMTPGVWLDGDWCWNMNPFVVSDENKEMVLDNICYLLKAFLQNTGYEYIIFCWVIHQEDIFDQLLTRLIEVEFELYKISLICSKKALTSRLQNDVNAGIRTPDVIERSIPRLALYRHMDTHKIDVSDITAEQAAQEIKQFLLNQA
ncbi:AAA family ATPase [Paenibacillus puldeungensis]|uniref:AAA family ATPase n=1 Tax=Paenibacillus puldeungensis TaxID=696536 RepID=A0ABW3RRN7_9BACL